MANRKIKLTQEAWGEIRNALMIQNKNVIKRVRTLKIFVLNNQKALNVIADEMATEFTDEKLMAILKNRGVIEEDKKDG